MAHKSFLTLINEALSECKVTLDPMTVTDFNNPTDARTILYGLFKGWVNRAYKYILIERNEWFFRNERAVVTIYPRLQLAMNGVDVINIGDILMGESSGVQIKVLDIHSVEDVETDVGVEYTISVEYVTGAGASDNLILNETFVDVTAPLAILGRIKGRGRYSLKELVPYVDQVDEQSFVIQPSIDLSASPSSTTLQNMPVLQFVPPSYYRDSFDLFSASSGTPTYVLRTPDGNYDFYPRPNEPFDLGFNYSQEPALMVSHDDVPELLDSKFDDLVMWTAVSYYADYDERAKLFSRAQKHMRKWSFLMDKEQLPAVGVNLYRFDYQ